LLVFILINITRNCQILLELLNTVLSWLYNYSDAAPSFHSFVIDILISVKTGAHKSYGLSKIPLVVVRMQIPHPVRGDVLRVFLHACHRRQKFNMLNNLWHAWRFLPSGRTGKSSSSYNIMRIRMHARVLYSATTTLLAAILICKTQVLYFNIPIASCLLFLCAPSRSHDQLKGLGGIGTQVLFNIPAT
jgi:hypothetical protein